MGCLGWGFWFAYNHCTSAFLKVLIYIISCSMGLVYSIWMHGRFGQTLGKMACKVVVLDVSERPLTMKQAVLRDILSVVLLPVCLLLEIPRILHGVDIYSVEQTSVADSVVHYAWQGWFWIEVVTMLTNKKRRALHDFIAGSVVVRKEEKVAASAETVLASN